MWVDPSPSNASRVYKALAAFGAPMDGVVEADFADPSVIFQIGMEPNRVDVIMGVGGLDFAEAWSRSVTSTYENVPIRILSKEDLITVKRRAGRPQDLLDVARLEIVAT